MDFMIKLEKNMEIIIFGITLHKFLIICQSQQLYKAVYFVFMEDFLQE
jgi:hypothetical protein